MKTMLLGTLKLAKCFLQSVNSFSPMLYSTSYARNLAQLILKHGDVGDATMIDSLTRRARDIV